MGEVSEFRQNNVTIKKKSCLFPLVRRNNDHGRKSQRPQATSVAKSSADVGAVTLTAIAVLTTPPPLRVAICRVCELGWCRNSHSHRGRSLRSNSLLLPLQQMAKRLTYSLRLLKIMCSKLGIY